MSKRKKDGQSSSNDELTAKKPKEFSFEDDFIPLVDFNSDTDKNNNLELDEDLDYDVDPISTMKPTCSSSLSPKPSCSTSSPSKSTTKSSKPTCSTNSNSSSKSKRSINSISCLAKESTNKNSNRNNQKNSKIKSNKSNSLDLNIVEITLDDSDTDSQITNNSKINNLKNQDSINQNGDESMSSDDLNDLTKIKGFHDFNKSDLAKSNNDDSSVSSYCEVLNYESDNGVFDMDHGCIDLNISLDARVKSSKSRKHDTSTLDNNNYGQATTNITNRTIESFKSQKCRDWYLTNLEDERLKSKINTEEEALEQEKESDYETESDNDYLHEPDLEESVIPINKPISILDIDKSLSKRKMTNKPTKKQEPPVIDQAEYLHPWINKKTYSPGILGLHEEINDFYNYSKLKPEEIKVRNLLFSKVKKVILSKWPKAKVFLFGSFQSGLSLLTADLDLVVFHVTRKIPFGQLEQKLIEDGITTYENTKIISKATVPILKFIHNETGLNVDISFNCSDGPCAIKLIKSYIKKYPALPKILLTIKQFLSQRNLAFAYTGGLSSYSVTLMLISFFQNHPHSNANEKNANLGVLLLEFFELYGMTFNFKVYGIRILKSNNQEGYVRKQELDCVSKFELSQQRLAIEDPLDKTNNPAKNSFLFEKIRRAFRNSFYYLNSRCGFKQASNYRNENRTNKPMLSELIGYTAEDVEIRTKVLAYYEREFNIKTNKKSKFDYNSDFIAFTSNIYEEPISNEELIDEYDNDNNTTISSLLI